MQNLLNCSGRFDLVVYTADTALCIDYKTGYTEPIEAQQSAQMRVLAVLVGLNLPTIKEVIVQIVSGPFGVSEARYSVADLVELYKAMEATLEYLKDPDAPLSPAPELCRKCPAKLVCPAIKALVVPVSRHIVGPLPEGERAAKLLDEITVLEGHFSEIRKYYSQKLAEGGRVPGYSLVAGPARREISDWKGAKERLAKWLEPADIDSAASPSITILERTLGKRLGLKGLPLKSKLAEILGELLEFKQPGASLKRTSGEAKFNELEAA